MSSMTLELPETLRRRLEVQAQDEGVSLSQFILYTLAQQASIAYYVHPVSPETQQQEQEAFARLLSRVPAATDEEMEKFLAEREPSEPEPGLSPEIIARLQERIRSKSAASNKS